MSGGGWSIILAGATMGIYVLQPHLGMRVFRKALGLAFFLQIFYLIGHYLWSWPFPTPSSIVQILIAVGLGIALGAMFSKLWPLPMHKGIERIFRTLLLCIPALGLGIGIQVLLQGNQPTQALYLIFTLAAWIGSGHFVRLEAKTS